MSTVNEELQATENIVAFVDEGTSNNLKELMGVSCFSKNVKCLL